MQQKIFDGKGSRHRKNNRCKRARKGTLWLRPDNVLWKSFLESETRWHQWIKQLLRIFGPALIRIDEFIKTTRSAVIQNGAERGYFFVASAVKFWKHDISSASERAFPGFFGDIFCCSTLSKKRCFSTEEFTRFLSTMSSQHRATRSDVSSQT